MKTKVAIGVRYTDALPTIFAGNHMSLKDSPTPFPRRKVDRRRLYCTSPGI